MQNPSQEDEAVFEEFTLLVADNWINRLIGLLRYNKIDQNTALWLTPCASIHTMWMRFSIDVIFLDKSHKVLKISENVRPFLFRVAPPNTCSVIEVAAHNAKRLGFNVNKVVNLQQY